MNGILHQKAHEAQLIYRPAHCNASPWQRDGSVSALLRGELISFELFLKHHEPCCDDHSNPCDGCEDQETIFSLDDFRTPHSDIPVIASSTAALAQPSFHLPSTQFFESRNYTTSKKAPPGWSGRYRSILFQSFLL